MKDVCGSLLKSGRSIKHLPRCGRLILFNERQSPRKASEPHVTISCVTTRTPKGRVFVIVGLFAGLPFKIMGQQPFLVDDAGITERHHLQLSLLNEYDTLQTALFPNQNQNAARGMITFGLTNRIEIGADGALDLNLT
jgi:hypothetical protein